MKKKSLAFSLLEIMLALTILASASIGVFFLMNRAQSNAAVEMEQRQLDTLIEGIQGQFMASADFSGLTTQTVIDSRLQGLRVSGGELSSGFNTPVTIRPASQDNANDSFEVVYQGLNTQQCLKMIPALYSKSHNIYVGAGDNPTTSVQETAGSGAGRLMGEDTLLAACSESAFDDNNGTVVFRIFAPRNTDTVVLDPTDCLCAPTTEDQTIGCPAGQVGSIRQTRNGTCTGGTPTCPDLAWGGWTTTSNTCVTPPPAPPPAPPVVIDLSPSCTPYTVNRTEACPTAGDVGQRVVQDNYTCTPPSITPTLGTSVLVSNTCAPPPPVVTTCTPSTQTRYVACPAGQGGQIIEEQSSTCPTSTSAPVWGTWVETSRTCTATCITAGNCCTPGRDNQTTSTACAAGTYGGPIATGQERTSTCASATATPVWGAWYDVSTAGTCTSCPGSTNETQTRWVSSSAACPAGQTGSHVWEEEQISTRTVSYSCPAGTTSLPGPTYGAWGGWSNTGARRNEFNTCAPPPTACGVIVPYSVPTSGIYDEPSWAFYQATLGGTTINYSCDGWASGVCNAPVESWLNARGYSAAGNTRVPSSGPGSIHYAPGGERIWGMPNFYLLSGQSCAAGDGFHARGLDQSCGVGNPCGDFEYGWSCDTSSCVVPCTGDPNETQWVPRSGVCPAGQVGSVTWEQEQGRSRVCNSGTWSSWGMWSDTANTRNLVNTCVPATCSGSPTDTQWVPRSAACPAGHTGSNTWEAEQVRTRVCTAGVWGAYGGWSDTGATRNAVNTCAPPVTNTCGDYAEWGRDTLSSSNCTAYSIYSYPDNSRVIYAGSTAWIEYSPGNWSDIGAILTTHGCGFDGGLGPYNPAVHGAVPAYICTPGRPAGYVVQNCSNESDVNYGFGCVVNWVSGSYIVPFVGPSGTGAVATYYRCDGYDTGGGGTGCSDERANYADSRCASGQAQFWHFGQVGQFTCL